MKLRCVWELFLCSGFFFKVILGVTFSGILLTVLYGVTTIAYLAGFLFFVFAFNAVAANWEMLMSAK